MTTLPNTTSAPGKAQPTRTRGPIVAMRAGVIGLEYSCGCFIPGPISGEAGARVKDIFRRISPCPICHPRGAAFANEMAGFIVIPEARP